MFHEEAAPSGYLVAEDVWFEVTDTREIQKVVMVNVEELEPPEDNPKSAEVIEKKSAGNRDMIVPFRYGWLLEVWDLLEWLYCWCGDGVR